MHTNSVPDEEPEGEQTMRGVVGGTKLFNRFTLQKVLGRGGMGIVWLARDERLDRLVALKLVPESVCFDPSAHEDLRRETRKSLMLTHPNIVRIFDFIEDERSAAISMEYVDGATVSSMRVKKPSKCFEVEEVAPWVNSWCDALTYAHESAKLVHRDLKPSNLMVNSKGELKITDFGIACTLRDSMTYISVRTSSGTLNYMSPQQLLGEDPAPSDDIYSLGATLYEMLSSKPPFFGGDVASQVREVVAPTIAQRRAKFGINGAPIPKYWEETIAGCLAKTPEQRPRTPSEIARRLRLGGPVRLRAEEKPKGIFSKVSELVVKVDHRTAALAGGVLVLGMAGGLLLGHSKKSNAPVAYRHATSEAPPVKSEAPAPYATEKHSAAVGQPQSPPVVASFTRSPAPEVKLTTAAPESSDPAAGIALPTPKTAANNAALKLTTTPTGASYAVYPGVIANKTAPSASPLHSGSTPDSIEDLPPGRYTLFFHNEGWSDDRAEISVNAGESVPVDYTFPHGTANITSTPNGAEIFLGTRSLGNTPLTVDLPLGKQKLIARLPDRPERSQAVTIGSATPATIAFQMSARRSSKAKATPTPSALDKIGQTFKHVFGGKATPAPKKKR
jgi:serine/threonine protein kinase